MAAMLKHRTSSSILLVLALVGDGVMAQSLPAISLPTPTSVPGLASDGSGAAPYRTSPSFLLFAIQSLLIGVFLVLFGKRGWRITCAFGGGLALMLVTWVGIVNGTTSGGFGHSKRTDDLIIWVITVIGGIVGAAVGSVGPLWEVGMLAMSACGGLSLAFSIVMMANNDLAPVARWIIVAVLCLLGLMIGPLFQKSFGMALTTSLSGAFLFFLGVDLLVNQTAGMSLGLRYLLDHNGVHAAALSTYQPPVSTRIFLGLIWLVSVLFTIFQTLVYRNSPFNRTWQDLNTFDDVQRARNVTSPSGSTTPALTEMAMSHDSLESRMQRRYRTAAGIEKREESTEPSFDGAHGSDTGFDGLRRGQGGAFGDPQEMSSPDSPPSRPSSIISTSFANGLRSRPPTFFNEPLGTPLIAPPPLPEPAWPPGASRQLALSSAFDSSFPPVPIAATAAAAAASAPTHASDGGATIPLVRKPSPTHSSLSSKSSNRSDRKSWRKPVPSIVPQDYELDVSSPSPIERPAATAIQGGFNAGLLSGRDQSITGSASTPSSGATSAILSPTFGSPTLRPSPPAIPLKSPERQKSIEDMQRREVSTRRPSLAAGAREDSWFALTENKRPSGVVEINRLVPSDVGESEYDERLDTRGEVKTPDLVPDSDDGATATEGTEPRTPVGTLVAKLGMSSPLTRKGGNLKM